LRRVLFAPVERIRRCECLFFRVGFAVAFAARRPENPNYVRFATDSREFFAQSADAAPAFILRLKPVLLLR
jgi:hypothetical protein